MVLRYLSVIRSDSAAIPCNYLWRTTLLAAALALVSAPPIRGQSAPAASTPLPSFEVASVKLCRSVENTEFHILPNRLIVRNYLIEMLIEFAYGHDLGEFGYSFLRQNQIVGGPSWIRGEEFGYDGYDIDAKVDDSLAVKFGKDCGPAFFSGRCGYREQMILMLQSLLADRFKLKVRREIKELPVYALVVAKGGPEFLDTTCPERDSAATAPNSTLPPPKPPPCPSGMLCSQLYMSMGQMADSLSSRLDRPVIDQTGLQGRYCMKIQYARPQPASSNAGMNIPPPLGPSGPSLPEALQQQLGLKLKPTKGPVEFLVIDHIERPSEN
ncbi:MAG: TIGR03435 family protein [Terriglobia bacterium]